MAELEVQWEWKVTVEHSLAEHYYTVRVWERSKQGEEVSDWKLVLRGGGSDHAYSMRHRTVISRLIKSLMH